MSCTRCKSVSLIYVKSACHTYYTTLMNIYRWWNAHGLLGLLRLATDSPKFWSSGSESINSSSDEIFQSLSEVYLDIQTTIGKVYTVYTSCWILPIFSILSAFNVVLSVDSTLYHLMLLSDYSTFRLFSDYIFLKLGDPTPKAFHGKVLRAITMFNNCRKNHTVRACLFSRELHVKLPVRHQTWIAPISRNAWIPGTWGYSHFVHVTLRQNWNTKFRLQE